MVLQTPATLFYASDLTDLDIDLPTTSNCLTSAVMNSLVLPSFPTCLTVASFKLQLHKEIKDEDTAFTRRFVSWSKCLIGSLTRSLPVMNNGRHGLLKPSIDTKALSILLTITSKVPPSTICLFIGKLVLRLLGLFWLWLRPTLSHVPCMPKPMIS